MKITLIVLISINGIIMLTIALLTYRMFCLVKRARELNNSIHTNLAKTTLSIKRIVVQTLLVSLSGDTASKKKLEKMLEDE